MADDELPDGDGLCNHIHKEYRGNAGALLGSLQRRADPSHNANSTAMITLTTQDLVIGERYFLDKTMDGEGEYIGVNGNREPRCNVKSIGFRDIKYHRPSVIYYQELNGVVWLLDLPDNEFYKH